MGVPLGEPYNAENPFGGVAYGVSKTTVRVFLPSSHNGYLVCMDAGWGGGQLQQMSKTGKLVVMAFPHMGMYRFLTV